MGEPEREFFLWGQSTRRSCTSAGRMSLLALTSPAGRLTFSHSIRGAGRPPLDRHSSFTWSPSLKVAEGGWSCWDVIGCWCVVSTNKRSLTSSSGSLGRAGGAGNGERFHWEASLVARGDCCHSVGVNLNKRARGKSLES